MLLRVVCLKAMLSALPPEPDLQTLFCGTVIGLLNDLVDNCIVLIDESGVATEELFSVARSWPMKFRKSVQNLLTVLRTRHRFIKIPNGYLLSHHCPETSCKYCIGIANAEGPNAVVVAGPCICPTVDFEIPAAVKVQEYTTSQFYEVRRKALTYQINRGEWTQSEFEAKVLTPIFAYAKIVKIYDKWIGNSIVTRGLNRIVLDATQVNERYKNTLDWMIDVFIRVCRQADKRLEIYSSIDIRNKDKKEIAITVAALQHFQNEVRRKYNFPGFAVIIKEETGTARMFHARYLITDQVGVVMERGFDLLMDDSMMMDMGMDPRRNARRMLDCVVAFCPEASKVEAAVRMLPSLA